jgi:hypothetical protein
VLTQRLHCRYGGKQTWHAGPRDNYALAVNDKIGSASVYSFMEKISVRKLMISPCK